jgi:hypothetical protein
VTKHEDDVKARDQELGFHKIMIMFATSDEIAIE